jgi:Tetratricopeptide repeat.
LIPAYIQHGRLMHMHFSVSDENEEALVSLDRALEGVPDRHRLWYAKGKALVALDRFEEALRSFEKAYELQPERAYMEEIRRCRQKAA